MSSGCIRASVLINQIDNDRSGADEEKWTYLIGLP